MGATTVGVSPLVQTQFSYAETGVTLVIQPTVHSADELTMHVEVTVAGVQQYENIGGISQPVISQQKNLTDVRMRNGEVSLLGGLNQTTDSSTVNGIPGLTNIPVLGKFLFGSQSTEKDSSQLLIFMTPHIVRTPDYSPENLKGIFAGSDQNVRIIHTQLPDAAPVILPPAAPAPAAAPAPQPAPAKPEAGAPPAVTVPPVATVPPVVSVPPVVTVPPAAGVPPVATGPAAATAPQATAPSANAAGGRVSASCRAPCKWRRPDRSV